VGGGWGGGGVGGGRPHIGRSLSGESIRRSAGLDAVFADRPIHTFSIEFESSPAPPPPPPPPIFSIGFSLFPTVVASGAYAREAAGANLKTNHHEYLWERPALENRLPKLTWHYLTAVLLGILGDSTRQIPCRGPLAGSNRPALSGAGGDELFAWYNATKRCVCEPVLDMFLPPPPPPRIRAEICRLEDLAAHPDFPDQSAGVCRTRRETVSRRGSPESPELRYLSGSDLVANETAGTLFALVQRQKNVWAGFDSSPEFLARVPIDEWPATCDLVTRRPASMWLS